MTKRGTRHQSSPSVELWPTLEADEAELVAQVDRRLGRSPRRPEASEPSWLVEAFEAAWPRLLQQAEVAED